MKKSRILAVILILVLLVTMIPSQNVEAASKKRKAMKAYSKYLKQHPSKIDEIADSFYDASFSLDDLTYVDSYSIKDLNKDKVPELITYTSVNFKWCIIRIYTWKNNNVKLYAEFNNCSTADGWYSFYLCKKGHIHNDYSGSYGVECNTYKAGKNKANAYLTYAEDYLYETKSITKNGKTISQKKYNKLVKECSEKELKIYKNNKKNQKLLNKGKVGNI